ncbi:MAG: DUF4956 domain-containing protein, partial [Rickettsiales bacterium]|nr:DUF4956 domain-containing protein [Rickettsiales bacterium]
HYLKFARVLAKRDSFAALFPFLVLIITLIITIVKSSLALSLGLVGALSIVRFRTPIKEPEELVYLFMAIAMGLGLGAGQLQATVAASLFILLAVTIIQRVHKPEFEQHMFLSLDWVGKKKKLTIEQLNEVIKTHIPVFELRRVDSNGTDISASYMVPVKHAGQLQAVLSDIEKKYSGMEITVIDQHRIPGVSPPVSMRIASPEHTPSSGPSVITRYGPFIAILLIVIMAIGWWFGLDADERRSRFHEMRISASQWLPVEWDHHYYDIINRGDESDINPVSNYIAGLGTALPEIHISIKFKHLEKLYQLRENVLQRGNATEAEKETVPAKIYFKGEEYPADIRLKGSGLDHYQTEKWSFRVQLGKKAAIMGMQEFSLQAPATRGYQTVPIFNDYLREQGFMATRFAFVDMVVNGENIGIMAMEEHFSKELPEAHQRRETAILRFSENAVQFMRAQVGYDMGDHWQALPIRAYKPGRIEKDPALADYYIMAAGLLRGLTTGELQPSQVFDPERTGKLLAILDVWAAWHSLYSGDLRFYMNPVNGTLEMMPYDTMPGYVYIKLALLHFRHRLAFAQHLLDDPQIRESYQRHLAALTTDEALENVMRFVREREAEYLPQLYREFPFLPSISQAFFIGRQHLLQEIATNWNDTDILAGAPSARGPHLVQPEKDYPLLIYGHLVAEEGQPYLELVNAMDHPVTVTHLRIGDEEAFTGELPLTLPATGFNQLHVPVKLPVSAADVKKSITGEATM